MNIGIDIDGVINDLSLFHITCGTEFCYENDITITINEHAMDSQDIFSWNQSIDDIFWEKNYLRLLLYSDFTRFYVSQVTHSLCSNGHNIYFISARKDAELPYFEKRNMYDLTQMYLHNCNVNYNHLILSDNKWELIKSLNIDLMIEDNPSFFTSSKRSLSIPLMCFNTPYNQDVCGFNITRVYSWHDILFKIKNEMYKEDNYER